MLSLSKAAVILYLHEYNASFFFPHFTGLRKHIALYSKPRYDYNATFFFSLLLMLATASFTHRQTPELIGEASFATA